MNSLFDITILCISTVTPYEWLKRFSEFLSEEIKDGAWIRGWPELSSWLLNSWQETPPPMTLPKGCVERLESTARILDPDVVARMIARSQTHLYRVSDTDELLAFFFNSWECDSLALILFPTNCSHDDESLILSTADNLGVKSYPALNVSASWFVTVNLEGEDDPFVCFASKNSDRIESLRRIFSDDVYPLDEFIEEYEYPTHNGKNKDH